MIENLHAELQRFIDQLNIPVATAGVLSTEAVPQIEAVGYCCRGGVEAVKGNDKWHIGSCAKSIAAVLFARMSELWEQRTIEELFLCTAGMRANPSKKQMISGDADRRPLTDQRTEVVATALADAPEAPGRFVYSNLSYITIGAAIDRIAQQSFEQALDELVLKPCGLTSLGYGPPPSVCGHKSRLRLGSLLACLLACRVPILCGQLPR